MNGNEYQRLAARTLIDKPDFELTPTEMRIVWNTTGITGEAGESQNWSKKEFSTGMDLTGD